MSEKTNRRIVSRRLLLAGAAVLVARPSGAADPIEAVLFKDPNCGCCEGHARHLEQNGFRVEVRTTADQAAIRKAQGVPDDLAGCHTILIGDRVVEGHVPADVIKRFLADSASPFKGIAIPGMPAGVPGMPGPRESPLQVFAFDPIGTASLYAVL